MYKVFSDTSAILKNLLFCNERDNMSFPFYKIYHYCHARDPGSIPGMDMVSFS